ncbi:MAG TPA: hypothetical protein VG269_20420 [Tepidisphaeraceae bacterium]|jgi:hypothetical protein|nr:hypothetical protein [Tepidisphaeraceae bacterium]
MSKTGADRAKLRETRSVRRVDRGKASCRSKEWQSLAEVRNTTRRAAWAR